MTSKPKESESVPVKARANSFDMFRSSVPRSSATVVCAAANERRPVTQICSRRSFAVAEVENPPCKFLPTTGRHARFRYGPSLTSSWTVASPAVGVGAAIDGALRALFAGIAGDYAAGEPVPAAQVQRRTVARAPRVRAGQVARDVEPAPATFADLPARRAVVGSRYEAEGSAAVRQREVGRAEALIRRAGDEGGVGAPDDPVRGRADVRVVGAAVLAVQRVHLAAAAAVQADAVRSAECVGAGGRAGDRGIAARRDHRAGEAGPAGLVGRAIEVRIDQAEHRAVRDPVARTRVFGARLVGEHAGDGAAGLPADAAVGGAVRLRLPRPGVVVDDAFVQLVALTVGRDVAPGLEACRHGRGGERAERQRGE